MLVRCPCGWNSTCFRISKCREFKLKLHSFVSSHSFKNGYIILSILLLFMMIMLKNRNRAWNRYVNMHESRNSYIYHINCLAFTIIGEKNNHWKGVFQLAKRMPWEVWQTSEIQWFWRMYHKTWASKTETVPLGSVHRDWMGWEDLQERNVGKVLVEKITIHLFSELEITGYCSILEYAYQYGSLANHQLSPVSVITNIIKHWSHGSVQCKWCGRHSSYECFFNR